MKRLLLALLLLTSPCFAARVFTGAEWFAKDNVTDDYGGAYPVSVALWFYASSDSAADSLFWWGDDTVSNQYIRILTRGDLAGDPIQLERANSAFTHIETTSGFTIDTWHHAAVVISSATSATIYLDGGSSATDANNVSYPSSPDNYNLGSRGNNTTLNELSGKMAYTTTWDSALTAGNISDLAGGDIPTTIDSGNIISYWKLDEPGAWFDALDAQGTNLLTRAGSPGYEDTSHLLDDPGPDGQQQVLITIMGM